MLDLYKLHIFLAVAQEGSFSSAADRLHMTQSAVSQHIKDLEASLGQTLFQRGRRGVTLTPQGDILEGYARDILALAAKAESTLTNVHQLTTGKVPLGATPGIATYLAPHWVQRFRALYPRLSTVLQTGITGHIVTGVLSGRLALGFVEGELDSYDHRALAWVGLEDIPQMVVAGFRHPWWERTSVRLRDLDNQTFIVRPPNSQTRIWLESILREHQVQIVINAEFDNLEAIKNAVTGGFCLTILPRYVIEQELQHGLLRTIEISDQPLVRTMKLVWDKRMPFTPIARAFLEMLRADYAALHPVLDSEDRRTPNGHAR